MMWQDASLKMISKNLIGLSSMKISLSDQSSTGICLNKDKQTGSVISIITQGKRGQLILPRSLANLFCYITQIRKKFVRLLRYNFQKIRENYLLWGSTWIRSNNSELAEWTHKIVQLFVINLICNNFYVYGSLIFFLITFFR